MTMPWDAIGVLTAIGAAMVALASGYMRSVVGGMESKLGGRMDTIVARMDAQNGKVNRNVADIAEVRFTQLDLMNKLVASQQDAAKATQALHERLLHREEHHA